MTEREAIKVIEWIKNTHPERITCEALTLAIAALEKQEKDGWIPVTERLPEKNDFVLVTISGMASDGKSWKHTMTLAVWTGDSWDLVDADMSAFRIFAWRPLPEPYTEEEA